MGAGPCPVHPGRDRPGPWRPESRRANLEDAAARYAAAGMHLCAAATRRRLGVLLGGDAGHTLVAEADSWMTGQQIRNPQRMADLYAPGFPS